MKINKAIIPLIILVTTTTFCFLSCSPLSPGDQTIEETAQETAEEIAVEEPEEAAEGEQPEEVVEETEPNIALEIVKLAKSQIGIGKLNGKITGNGPFANLIWADSNTNITYCDRFVSAVMAIATGKPLSERKSYNTAYDDYSAQLTQGVLIKSGEPPKGAVVYFGKDETNAYYIKAANGNNVKVYGGHVGISDGEGNIISVLTIKEGVCIRPLKKFKAPLLGWITFEEY